ncbi:MAG: fumarate hydratase C-terminal domain-containing protein [Methanotrichaceae archaeon]|nr:fumarate hydratase C-terminal domain-containing protein [Methanotrichaceae archaeon]
MEHRLRTPLTSEEVLLLRAGDIVWLSGTIYTARDKAHARLSSWRDLIPLEGAVIYHCGPLLSGGDVISAGPTTSGRMARYASQVVDLGVRAIIGKGGLPGAADCLRGRAVYLAYPGGCGASASGQLRVKGSFLSDLGMAESIWEMEADDLGPMVVAIDAHGRDLYEEVRTRAQERLKC